MTTDIQTCDTHPLGACGACERPAQRKEDVELGIASPVRHLLLTEPVRATGGCTLDHVHDYMCDPEICTGCDQRNCDGGCV